MIDLWSLQANLSEPRYMSVFCFDADIDAGGGFMAAAHTLMPCQAASHILPAKMICELWLRCQEAKAKPRQWSVLIQKKVCLRRNWERVILTMKAVTWLSLWEWVVMVHNYGIYTSTSLSFNHYCFNFQTKWIKGCRACIQALLQITYNILQINILFYLSSKNKEEWVNSCIGNANISILVNLAIFGI